MSLVKNCFEALVVGLDGLNANGTEWIPGERVLHIFSPHALAQAIGYLKYTGGNTKTQVLFRGQSAFFGSMLPPAYRPYKHIPTITKERIDGEINKYILECKERGSFLNGTPESSYEPILQHYGLRTRWLDIVDNIWVALWFACHETVSYRSTRQYWTIERRSVSKDPKGYAYIILFAFQNAREVSSSPGQTRGSNFRIVDLRVSAPSLYFRPHAQHGLLFRRSGPPSSNEMDLSDLIAGIIRVGITDALNWLGTGDLLSVQTLFPSPIYDIGYRFLLENLPEGNYDVGSIAHVGP
jgi:hypothetical protein